MVCRCNNKSKLVKWKPKCGYCLSKMTPTQLKNHYKKMNNEIKELKVNKDLNNLDINEYSGVSINYIKRKPYLGITHGINAYLPIPSVSELLSSTKYYGIFKKRHNAFHKGNKPRWLMRSGIVQFT